MPDGGRARPEINVEKRYLGTGHRGLFDTASAIHDDRRQSRLGPDNRCEALANELMVVDDGNSQRERRPDSHPRRMQVRHSSLRG